ncbi:MAG: class I SAM-dependent rRNA methyltransferase [Verrucomicrobia bacterium]|nr:class I SAM-dependent rRNA methyltransferase [Verrucomicrobiota bacterium]
MAPFLSCQGLGPTTKSSGTKADLVRGRCFSRAGLGSIWQAPGGPGDHARNGEALVGGLEVPVDLQGGQKTGTYLDQQENYGKVAARAKGRRMLDLFCHTGGFSLRAAKAGATQVTALDQSEPSLRLGRQAAEWHGLAVKWVKDDAFRFLRGTRKGEYDLVVLDPPGLVKGKSGLEAGLAALGELHRQAFRVLPEGGLLATFSCSHRVGRRELLDVVKRSAQEAGRRVFRREILTQASDHPVDVAFPESEYLTGFLLETI